jgi:large subunit ribosomal protein L4
MTCYDACIISSRLSCRSYAFALNKKVRRLGLKCALSAKSNEGRLLLVDSLLLPDAPKTKIMMQKLQRLLEGNPRISVLLVDSAKTGQGAGGAEVT